MGPLGHFTNAFKCFWTMPQWYDELFVPDNTFICRFTHAASIGYNAENSRTISVSKFSLRAVYQGSIKGKIRSSRNKSSLGGQVSHPLAGYSFRKTDAFFLPKAFLIIVQGQFRYLQSYDGNYMKVPFTWSFRSKKPCLENPSTYGQKKTDPVSTS